MELTPPPLLYMHFGGDLNRLIYHMQQLTELHVQELNQARTRPVLGADALQQIHPFDQPRTRRETRGQRVPSFQIGARGQDGSNLYRRCCQETSQFRTSHREARESLLAGNLQTLFPYGTYQWRCIRGVHVHPPPGPHKAVLCTPGPTLEEAKALLGQQTEKTDRQHAALLEEVRSALTGEAADTVNQRHIDLRPQPELPIGQLRTSLEVEPEPNEEDTKPVASVRRRFDPKPHARPDAPRIITLRDDPRRKQRNRSASDPPED